MAVHFVNAENVLTCGTEWRAGNCGIWQSSTIRLVPLTGVCLNCYWGVTLTLDSPAQFSQTHHIARTTSAIAAVVVNEVPGSHRDKWLCNKPQSYLQQREIGIAQLGVLSGHSDADSIGGVKHAINDGLPPCQGGLRTRGFWLQAEVAQQKARDLLLLQAQRNLIQIVHITGLNHLWS